MKVKSCPTLCNPMDCSLPGSFVHGLFQAIVLEWIANFLLQGIFLTQGSNPGLLHCRQALYHLSHQGSYDQMTYGHLIWQHIKKQRHYFANKGPCSQSYGFSNSLVWMWDLDHKESWGPKNWCFWTVVLERLFRVPWTARRSNLSILKWISPEYSLEGLVLKLKLQYFGYLIWRTDSWERPWC